MQNYTRYVETIFSLDGWKIALSRWVILVPHRTLLCSTFLIGNRRLPIARSRSLRTDFRPSFRTSTSVHIWLFYDPSSESAHGVNGPFCPTFTSVRLWQITMVRGPNRSIRWTARTYILFRYSYGRMNRSRTAVFVRGGLVGNRPRLWDFWKLRLGRTLGQIRPINSGDST